VEGAMDFFFFILGLVVVGVVLYYLKYTSDSE
jgi:hypothetical protein